MNFHIQLGYDFINFFFFSFGDYTSNQPGEMLGA